MLNPELTPITKMILSLREIYHLQPNYQSYTGRELNPGRRYGNLVRHSLDRPDSISFSFTDFVKNRCRYTKQDLNTTWQEYGECMNQLFFLILMTRILSFPQIKKLTAHSQYLNMVKTTCPNITWPFFRNNDEMRIFLETTLVLEYFS